MLMLERTLFCFKTRNVPSLQCPVLASEVENEILHQSAAAVAATFVLVLPQAAFHHGFPFFSSASSNPYSHEHPAVKKTKERERPSNPKNKKYSPVVLSIFLLLSLVWYLPSLWFLWHQPKPSPVHLYAPRFSRSTAAMPATRALLHSAAQSSLTTFSFSLLC